MTDLQDHVGCSRMRRLERVELSEIGSRRHWYKLCGAGRRKSFGAKGESKEPKMLSTVIFFLLLALTTSEIEFLSPPSGQDFATNDTILIKWSKVPGASNYTINWDTCDGSLSTSKTPSRCRPRVSLGPFEEGKWNVSVFALNQSGDVIDSRLVSFRVCESLPCPNGNESDEVPNVQFLTPTNGQDFIANDTVLIKWKKVAGVSDYSVAYLGGKGFVSKTIERTRCNPRYSFGPLPEGYYDVIIYAGNQTASNVTNSGLISIRVCESLPCPNGSATEAVCPVGQVLRYYTSPGYKVQDDIPHITIPAANDEECIDMCSKNALTIGVKQTAAPCRSVDFNNQTNNCKIYAMQTFPQGNTNLTNDSTTNHYEKVCVDATIGDRCRGPYFVEPQKNLGGTTLTSMNASNINACFQHCTDNIACKSAIFYPVKEKSQCGLYSFARSDGAPYVTEPAEIRIMYFEPGCAE